jgi:sortase (surface protein transpeptidase)
MVRTTWWGRSRRGAVTALCACLVVLTGCSAAASQPPTPAAGAPSGAAAQPAPPAAAESPADGALRLEALLGQHMIRVGDLMRSRLRKDDDFAQAASAALGQNSDELARLVGTLAGAEAADRFQGLWNDHVTALVNYSRGLATDDARVRDEALAKLDSVNGELADLVATGSQGRLDPAAARAALTTHEHHLTEQADAYAAGDYARANALYREGYQHAFALGGTVAHALVPPDQAGELDTPGWQLRSEMTRLLGEHVGLALGTLRAGATRAPDFPAMMDSLNGNTTDVTAAVSSLFGEPAASQFMTLWADHLDLLGTYAADVGANDPNRRQAVQDDLHDWQQRFAAFIDTATGSRVPAPDLAAALLGLDDLLLQQVDAFAARDFPRAQQLGDQTYPQVYGLARNLADAFGATLAARMPQGGARTGAGGMAGALVPAAAVPLPPVEAQPFHSVRTYQEVAEPVRLRIPAVRIDTALQRLGRAADRSVEVPTDVGVAGWFADGPRPGQNGPAVILGHVDSRNGPGVFYPLAGLAPGSEILVDRADGSTAAFRVNGVATVPKTGFPTEQVYGPTLRSSLRLVTCGGPFDHAAGSYRDNVIVSADPVQ